MTLPTLRVTTAHSSYLIDQGRGVFTRTRVHPDAKDLSYGGVGDDPVEYEEILSDLQVGNAVVITLPGGRWVRSTAIQSVEELPVEVSA